MTYHSNPLDPPPGSWFQQWGPVQQGWQCPVCKRVYAPFVPQCMYCIPPAVSTSNTGGTTP